MRKPMLLAASHLLCFAVGALLIRAKNDNPAVGQNSIGATKSHIRGDRKSAAGSVDAIAGNAIATSHAPAFDPDSAKQAAARIPVAGEGEKKVRELTANGTMDPPAGDEFAGAWLAWFRDDPVQALKFIEGAKTGKVYDALLADALAGLGAAEQIKIAVEWSHSPLSNGIAKALATKLAALDPADAAKQLSAAESYPDKLQLYVNLAKGWPDGDAAGFLEMALAGNDADEMVRYFLSAVHPRKASALLRIMEDRGDLPEALSGLVDSGELKGHLYRYADPSVPLDERIAQMRNLEWLKNATPEALRDGALKQISTVDINELMKTGTDYRYAFRHGTMTAEEILEAVKKELPELAAATEYETRVRVFNELASENAEAAFSLIAGLPEEQRNLAVLHQSRWTFRDTSPDAFFAMIDLAPGPDNAAATEPRADAWKNYGRSAYREYGDYYLDWVRELPAGLNRDVARTTLAEVLRKQNKPDLAAEFEKP